MAISAGTIIPYGGSSAPTGFLLCDGSAVSRTTYSTLFGVIGTTFGSGDGSTTFNLPDLRGRVVAGKDNMGGTAAGRLTNSTMSPDGTTLGATGGEQTHTLMTAEMPAHSHELYSDDATANASTVGGFGETTVSMVCGKVTTGTDGYYSIAASGSYDLVQATGSGDPHNNVQPTLILNYIIATQDVAGTGTVTSVSVVAANGFAGTVANSTTTPAITMSTSVTGVLVGNGTALSGVSIGTSGRLLIDQGGSSNPSFNALSGDATITNTGAITVTKTNGTAFAPSAITDTTNAANISSGTIPGARLGTVGGTYLGDSQTVAQTLTLIAYAPYAFTINALKKLGTVSGTVTGTLNINGSPVTGCSSLSLTGTPQNATATGANTVSVGDTVTFVTSSPSGLMGLLPFSLIATRS